MIAHPECEKPAGVKSAGLHKTDQQPSKSKAQDSGNAAVKQDWAARNPLARWAHRAFESALKRGLVERKPCEICGSPQTEFHHFPDRYDEPLSGQHLCRKHHRQVHARLRQDGAR